MSCPPDLIHVRDWVHEFAADVVRPAAAEWDEREETPWPIIQEAAKVGLYSMELFAEQAGEPSGLGMLVVFEEMFWGDAGIALSILGTGLAAASLAANGTPEQLGEWLPQMFGTVDDPKVASFCSSEPGAGSDVGAILTRAALRRGHRRMGAQRHQDVGDQRRHRRGAHRGRLRAPRTRHAAGRRRSSSRRTHRASARARSSSSTASGPPTPPRWCWKTSASPAA